MAQHRLRLADCLWLLIHIVAVLLLQFFHEFNILFLSTRRRDALVRDLLPSLVLCFPLYTSNLSHLLSGTGVCDLPSNQTFLALVPCQTKDFGELACKGHKAGGDVSNHVVLLFQLEFKADLKQVIVARLRSQLPAVLDGLFECWRRHL